MPIESNQVVTINYVLTDEEGNLLDTTTGRESFSFLSGHQQILPKLEEAIQGMLIHSKKTVVLAPPDGYGEYVKEAVQVANRADFPNDVELEEGMSFMATMPDGNNQQFVIRKIEGDDVTIDFNHPLAGKTLTFEVELVDVRDATPEELAHGHVHGEGGHEH